MDASVAQFHLHARAAINPSIGIKDAMDLFGQFAIFPLVCAWFPSSPVKGFPEICVVVK